MKDDHQDFLQERTERIAVYSCDTSLLNSADNFLHESLRTQYSYNFDWIGLPIIQYPQEMIALQEIIWKTQPDLIIETGIARGGSLMLSASMLALLDLCEAIKNKECINPSLPKRWVLGIDVDIREHNRIRIEDHPLSNRIKMIEGSSIAEDVVDQVHAFARNYQRILVCLDSMHTHDHVLAELNAYAPLVSLNNYCVVFDTIIEDISPGSFPDRPWDKGNNPKTAVWEFLKTHNEFMVDKDIEHKLLITVAPDGYLKRVRHTS
jgi:cephalosporin hydroxylase